MGRRSTFVAHDDHLTTRQSEIVGVGRLGEPLLDRYRAHGHGRGSRPPRTRAAVSDSEGRIAGTSWPLYLKGGSQ